MNLKLSQYALLTLALTLLLNSSYTLWGLYTGWQRHGVRLPFFLGISAAVLLIPSFFVTSYLSFILLVLLLVATIWNTVAAKAARQA